MQATVELVREITWGIVLHTGEVELMHCVGGCVGVVCMMWWAQWDPNSEENGILIKNPVNALPIPLPLIKPKKKLKPPRPVVLFGTYSDSVYNLCVIPTTDSSNTYRCISFLT